MSKNKLLSLRTWVSPSVVASIVLILILNACYSWDAIDPLAPYLFPLLSRISLLCFIMIPIASLEAARQSQSNNFFYKYRFVILNSLAAVIAIFLPALKYVYDFHQNLPARMQVVELVKENKLGQYPYSGTLPPHLKHLSRGGSVMISSERLSSGKPDLATLHIFFLTFRGVLENCSGFDYSANDKPPPDAWQARQVVHLQKNWYWVEY